LQGFERDEPAKPLNCKFTVWLINILSIFARFNPFAVLSPLPAQLFARGFALLVRQQPWAAELLTPYSGKTIRVHLSSFQLALTINSSGHLVPADASIVPDVAIEVMLDRLQAGQWLMGSSNIDLAAFINVSGEAALAQVLSRLARDLRPDPEDALAHWLGDIAAVRLTRGFISTRDHVRDSITSLGQNIAEYLSHESHALTDAPSQKDFVSALKATAGEVDNLAMRQAELARRIEKMTTYPLSQKQ